MCVYASKYVWTCVCERFCMLLVFARSTVTSVICILSTAIAVQGRCRTHTHTYSYEHCHFDIIKWLHYKSATFSKEVKMLTFHINRACQYLSCLQAQIQPLTHIIYITLYYIIFISMVVSELIVNSWIKVH